MVREKTQSGNPHALTIRQHIFPAASISRFTDGTGCVRIVKKNGGRQLLLSPTDPYFCAPRVWDHGAEAGFMKDIEDKFQEIAGSVLDHDLREFSSEHNVALTDFFALWRARYLVNASPPTDVQLVGVLGLRHEYSKDEQEQLEKGGVNVIRSGGTMSARDIASHQISRHIIEIKRQLKGTAWGIVKAEVGEFLVPDTFGRHTALPLDPTSILIADIDNASIGEDSVRRLNQFAIAN